jgi:hypothetical protein
LNNPLFPPPKRTVTEQEFRNAKQLDERDAAAFRKAFANHLKEGRRLQGKETLAYVGNYLERTLELMERAAAIGGDWEDETRVLETALDASKQLLNSHTGKDAAALLERAIALHSLQIYNPFLAQSSRPDSPIPQKGDDEWLRALLSEDERAIEDSATFAGGLGLKIVEKARAILTEAVREGLPPVEARRKLGLLEAGYSKGAEIIAADLTEGK